MEIHITRDLLVKDAYYRACLRHLILIKDLFLLYFDVDEYAAYCLHVYQISSKVSYLYIEPVSRVGYKMCKCVCAILFLCLSIKFSVIIYLYLKAPTTRAGQLG